jgi:hypothetical protein
VLKFQRIYPFELIRMRKIIFVLWFAVCLAVSAFAAGPSVWSVNTRTEVMRGDARGVSIDDTGAITLAPKLAEIFKTDQPYVWSTVVDASGNIYLGTGSDGRVFQVNTSGRGWIYSDLPELNVSALAVGRGGELFAATSPDGKVYRILDGGKFDVYFDPKQKYIWSLAVMSDGSLAVGTGENGRIYRVRSANATPDASLLYDTSATHIFSLATDAGGNLYAGTDPGGLVLRFGSDGKPFALLDTSLREIHDIAIGQNGSIYVLALGESAAAKPAETPKPATTTEAKPVASQPAVQPPAKSRYDLTSAKSAVFRIAADGGVELIWSSTSVTAFSLYSHQTGSGVLVGTSDKGRIFNISNEGRETLVLQTDADQISNIFTARNGLWATSSNQAVLYRFGDGTVGEGVYESPVLDAKASAAWGRIWWRSAGSVQVESRSGNTEKPDETWSAWRAPSANAQVTSPRARFLQWRAVLRSGAVSARLDEVSVAYQPRNIAPEVLSISMLPTNVGLVPNPAPQIDPNIALSGLDPSVFGIPVVTVQPRKVYQRGATSLQWTADDRNGDKLVYDVFYREVADANFRPLRENIEDNFLTIDGQSLADGRYVFRVVAKDVHSNPVGEALSGDRLTEPIDIDNTPPTVTVTGPPGASRVTFTASDKSSYLTRAEYSVNGGEWRTVYPDDGISDSPDERYTVDLQSAAPGENVVTLRVFDVNGNSGNARAVLKR